MLGHDSVPMSSTSARISAFCTRFGLRVPILLAPMAGVSAGLYPPDFAARLRVKVTQCGH
jgi:hypothetical protein